VGEAICEGGKVKDGKYEDEAEGEAAVVGDGDGVYAGGVVFVGLGEGVGELVGDGVFDGDADGLLLLLDDGEGLVVSEGEGLAEVVGAGVAVSDGDAEAPAWATCVELFGEVSRSPIASCTPWVSPATTPHPNAAAITAVITDNERRSGFMPEV
jgi:hypothetical protein